MLRIGVDAMGGDFAPRAVVEGAILALDGIASQSRIVLFGDGQQIEAILSEHACRDERIEIVPTTEVIAMGEHPAQSFSKKPDSSIAVGFDHLKAGTIDGFASAGSTGAMMVGCMYSAKPIQSVIRPAISALLPTVGKSNVLLLDVGLNIDCKPDVLYQYGLIGSVYMQSVVGLENPRVALLNIGEEREKGNLATKAAYDMMAESGTFNFVGNIEARDLFTEEIADVVVCDGFVGNTILKQMEGFYNIAIARGLQDEFIDKLNYEVAGGTEVLGINAVVMIGHGCSSPLAIKNMILQTEKSIRGGLVHKLQEIFN